MSKLQRTEPYVHESRKITPGISRQQAISVSDNSMTDRSFVGEFWFESGTVDLRTWALADADWPSVRP